MKIFQFFWHLFICSKVDDKVNWQHIYGANKKLAATAACFNYSWVDVCPTTTSYYPSLQSN